MTTSEDQPYCAHCAQPITDGGRKAEVMFHINNPDCRNAGRRHRYKVQQDARADEWEARPCTFCHDAMPRRRRRSTDLPEGRWCLKWKCQRDKKLALRVAGKGPAEPQGEEMTQAEMEYRTDVFLKAFLAAALVTCSTCGRTDAKEGFEHPWPNDLNKLCHGEGLHGAPFWRPIQPKMLALARELWVR